MTEDPYALPPTGFDLLIDEIVRNPNDPPTPIRICGIEYVTTSNRWAAFTNDELEVFTHWIAFFDTAASELPPHIRDADTSLIAEIPAELARRKDA